VETEIGTTLREARIRHKVNLAEVEQRTKIRVRYLRALENEEWDLLPGPTYTRSFIRTYASFLGLDGERPRSEMARASGPGSWLLSRQRRWSWCCSCSASPAGRAMMAGVRPARPPEGP
jgi:cytoskeleton protein RodZ